MVCMMLMMMLLMMMTVKNIGSVTMLDNQCFFAFSPSPPPPSPCPEHKKRKKKRKRKNNNVVSFSPYPNALFFPVLSRPDFPIETIPLTQ